MTDDNRFEFSREDLEIMKLRDSFAHESLIKPERFWPWYRPCKVRVLLVADGGLDFSMDDFGLATFVLTLLNTYGPARFEITLGHLGNRSGDAMMSGEARIKDRKPNFKFDDTDDFTPDMYDVVFLFGIGSSRFGSGRTDASYPNGQLADSELQALATFQNGGGGLFATGDHGALGRYMGQGLARAGKMRLWDNTSANNDLNEVSMGGPRRNDTNRPGDPGSQFGDQSDDVPQDIVPRIYSVRRGLIRETFPHPLLCGPNGIIRVMPDHPHEGECIEPSNTSDTINFTASLGPEFPAATDGGVRPLPEVISTNSVLSGTVSGGKDPTQPHSFGGICAYDGHRASVGRVVTDATWHHFVNINLVGVVNPFDPDSTHPVKSKGFMASNAGKAHLANIRAYYRNLATWLAGPNLQECMNSVLVVHLVRKDRVMEAVLTHTDVRLNDLTVRNFREIGLHARDLLCRSLGRCRCWHLVIDLIWPEIIPEFLPHFDPWQPRPLPDDPRQKPDRDPFDVAEGIQWLNMDHALDAALGGALVAINEKFGLVDEPADDRDVRKLAREGARYGMKSAIAALDGTIDAYRSAMR